MKLKVVRLSDNGESIIGFLSVNGKFECWTLEHEKKAKKMSGEIKIPEGEYPVKFKKEGDIYNKYKITQKNVKNERGMLHIDDVPGFKDVMILGDDDTAGSLVVGDIANNNQVEKGRIYRNEKAYQKLYIKVADALEKGENVTIAFEEVKVADEKKPPTQNKTPSGDEKK